MHSKRRYKILYLFGHPGGSLFEITRASELFSRKLHAISRITKKSILLIPLSITLILHEWNDHLRIFSRPQVIENSRQYLPLRTDILQKSRWLPPALFLN